MRFVRFRQRVKSRLTRAVIAIAFIAVVAIPVLIIVPALLSAIPPLVEALVAVFAFPVQGFPALFHFVAVPAVVAKGIFVPGFRFLDSPLTLRSLVARAKARQPNKHQQESDHCERKGGALHPSVMASPRVFKFPPLTETRTF